FVGAPPYGQPFVGAPGFGFGPQDRRSLHEQRREARREFRDRVRGHAAGHDGPFGAGFGWTLGPGVGFGFGRGFGPRGGRRGAPGQRRRRGDVRAAILVLLAERPMHGYEMIQEIAERSQDLWRPSPGSVYPTLQMLVDEGLIVASETEGSKRLFELTEEGQAAAEKIATPPWDEIAEGVDPSHINLRDAVGQMIAALTQSAYAATADQQQRITEMVNNMRRDIYTVLGEDLSEDE
ncbi:MAG: PadR family transcriptional regulator, partial [Mycobacterium sp.]